LNSLQRSRRFAQDCAYGNAVGGKEKFGVLAIKALFHSRFQLENL
jgi:hypothetical protein